MTALIITAKDVADILGARSAGWFYQHRKSLERAGFPAKDHLLGGWHRSAVETWVAKRSGVVESLSLDAERRAMRGAIHERAERRRHALRH